MQHTVPRVAAVHDMSCFGRCSLTVIIPILSAMGIQVCPLPTAVLSTHLGGFADLAFCDFTGHMEGFYHHWRKEGIVFDCIYSGFLASKQQIEIVSAFIECFSENAPLVLVDPVMGDKGKLYATYTLEMQEKMKWLVQKADIITPNYTEACFLLGEPYQEKVADLDVLKKWLIRLREFGPTKVVMTGVPFGQDSILNIGYDDETQSFWEVSNTYIPASYPGTGDAFSSVLSGALLQGDNLPQAMQRAADFVAFCIKTTFAAATPTREGILVERALARLMG